ncbi:MAG: DUF2213 domain-containing protein [Candidatus Sphingomonas colombiensis]|nr:DUF2213 domain-containing protein [Sphingomonas sp.]WEK42973.1 MAG: DUF2213 domain-containing protein [Sphingomonas sp.]
MLFQDRALIDGPARITREGHLVASARVAKANNIQDYRADEIGEAPKADGSPYRIFRPEAAVFARDAIASATHRPITITHPKEDVNATNWKALSVGDTGGEVLRDGDFLRIPVMVMDAKGVNAARTTHQEFSLGYSAEIDMTPGRFGDAEYDGAMHSIRVNHLALVPAARGGAELRIVDERPSHLREHLETAPMKIRIGDAEVDATNGEAVSIAVQALNKKLGDSETALGTVTAKLADASTAIEGKDGEIAALKTQLADAQVTPAKLADMVKARAVLIDAALAMGVEITDADSDADIKKKAVAKKMGDAAVSLSDAAIDGAFAAFASSAGGEKKPDVLRDALAAQPITMSDAATSYAESRNKQKQALADAWRQPFAGEA